MRLAAAGSCRPPGRHRIWGVVRMVQIPHRLYSGKPNRSPRHEQSSFRAKAIAAGTFIPGCLQIAGIGAPELQCFAMNDIKIGEHDLLSFLKPDTVWGALIYFMIFLLLALLISRGFRAAVHASMTRKGHVDRTTINFLQQFGSVLIWVVVLILYAHLIPALRAMGTALLAGAGVVSVVIGLAAQSTLGNLVAGVAITLYRPFRLGDTLQVSAPTGTEVGRVEMLSRGYTPLRPPDGRLVVLPNSLAASQVALNLHGGLTATPLALMI